MHSTRVRRDHLATFEAVLVVGERFLGNLGSTPDTSSSCAERPLLRYRLQHPLPIPAFPLPALLGDIVS